MNLFREFFNLVIKAFKFALNPLVELAGMITALVGYVTMVLTGLWQDVGIETRIVDWINKVSDFVGEINNAIAQNDLWSFLVDMLALDTLVTAATSLVVSTFGVVIFLIGTLFAIGVPALLFFLSFRAILKAVRIITGGVVDP